MRVNAVIEIVRNADGDLPAALIRQAYAIAEGAMVVLLLGDVEPGEIDQVLDPVVAESLSYPGVMYCTDSSDPAFLPFLQSATVRIAQSDDFRSQLLRLNLKYHVMDEAAAALAKAGSPKLTLRRGTEPFARRSTEQPSNDAAFQS